jgi:hypothetical protein
MTGAGILKNINNRIKTKYSTLVKRTSLIHLVQRMQRRATKTIMYLHEELRKKERKER